jgi:hypothetical protein
MKAREICAAIFGFIIRILGVYFFYMAAINAPQVWRIITMPGRIVWSLAFDSLFLVAWQAVVAWWLVRGAPPVEDLAYPNSKQ